jgi:uncharacterized protein Yka (UPF0111/DUF47 family)
MPIPDISKSDQKKFTDLVIKIFATTKNEDYKSDIAKQAKIQDLEHQIDELVYKLYNLTEDEIKIVEAN